MKKVEAYLDNSGRVHLKVEEALEADAAVALQALFVARTKPSQGQSLSKDEVILFIIEHALIINSVTHELVNHRKAIMPEDLKYRPVPETTETIYEGPRR